MSASLDTEKYNASGVMVGRCVVPTNNLLALYVIRPSGNSDLLAARLVANSATAHIVRSTWSGGGENFNLLRDMPYIAKNVILGLLHADPTLNSALTCVITGSTAVKNTLETSTLYKLLSNYFPIS